MHDASRAQSSSGSSGDPRREGQPVFSTLRSDPDMLELIQLFVDELPDRVRKIQDYWSRGELNELKRVAHQLKGAGGGYGFMPVGDAAGDLERRLVDLAGQATEPDLKEIADRVDTLIGVCGRVRVS